MHQQKGYDFEYAVQAFFEERGFTVFETPQTNDFGADLILHYHGTSIAIQCKCHGAPIGIGAVQEVVAAVPYYSVDIGMVIANQPFTRQAKALAAANGILLVDRDGLRELLSDRTGDAQYLDALLHTVKASGFTVPIAQSEPSAIRPGNRKIRLRRLDSCIHPAQQAR